MSHPVDIFRAAAGTRFPERVMDGWRRGYDAGKLAICTLPEIDGAQILYSVEDNGPEGRILVGEAMTGRLLEKPGAAHVAAVLDHLARENRCSAVEFLTERPAVVRLLTGQGYECKASILRLEVAA